MFGSLIRRKETRLPNPEDGTFDSTTFTLSTAVPRPVERRNDERIAPTVHLIHGEFDSVVPPVFSQQALRGLRAVGADATLDVVENGSHSIGQDMVIVGTTRLLQTIFRGRRPRAARTSPGHTLH